MGLVNHRETNDGKGDYGEANHAERKLYSRCLVRTEAINCQENAK